MEPSGTQLFDEDEGLIETEFGQAAGGAGNPRGRREKPNSAVFRHEEEEK